MLMRRLLLIDFLNLAFRAFHAIPPLTSPPREDAPEGEDIALTHGVLSMTAGLIRAAGASHVAFAFDSRTPTFRAELRTLYKAQRKEPDQSLIAQLPRASQAIGMMGYGRYRADGFEADDVLATLAHQAEQANSFEHVFIATADRDLLSATSPHTTLLWTGRGISNLVWYTPDKVREVYQLEPEQMVELKALVGDSSDNFPGCPGIGPKGATDLLVRYGTVANIYEHLDELKPGPRKKLTALLGESTAADQQPQTARELVELCHRLAGLRRDAPVLLDPESGRLGADDREQTIGYLRTLGLNSIVAKLPPTVSS